MVIPNAWFSRIAQGIKDDADARSTIKKALADKVAERAVVDDGLLERMSSRWLGEEVKKQINRETVGNLALEDLRQLPPEEDSPVDDDFLNRFTTYAEQASTEEMQKLFGRVLAGEIRQPGSYSLAALHVLSIMDASLAKTVEEVSAWVLGDFIPFSKPLTSGDYLEKIGRLEDLGLIRSGLISRTFARNSAGFLNLAARNVVDAPAFACVCSGENTTIDAALITPTGAQIFSLSSPRWDNDALRTVAQALKSNSGVTEIQLGKIEKGADGSLRVTDKMPFDPPLTS